MIKILNFKRNQGFKDKIRDLYRLPFFMYRPSEILYYRYFYNNIYAIDDKQNVSVKYNIDFGENNMPFDLSWRDRI